MTDAAAPPAENDQDILVEDNGTWAVVTFHRPTKRNAFTEAMTAQLLAALHDLSSARVIVLTGAGPAFCAGVDLAEVQRKRAAAAAGGPAFAVDRGLWFDVHEAIRQHPAVFIAAVNGYALGGGSTFVNNCELAIAAESAQIGTPEIGFGQMPVPAAPAMATRLLPKHAAEIVLLATRVDAATAYRMGMVNEVVPDDRLLARAREMAEHVAQFDGATLARAKQALRAMVNASWDDAMDLGTDALRELAARQAEGFTAADFVAGGRSSGQGT